MGKRINLTPNSITFYDNNNQLYTLPPAGTLYRVNTLIEDKGRVEGVKKTKKTFEPLTEDTISQIEFASRGYDLAVVSTVLARALVEKKHLLENPSKYHFVSNFVRANGGHQIIGGDNLTEIEDIE